MASKITITESIDRIYQKLTSTQTYHEALEDFKSLIETNTSIVFMKELTKHFIQINPSNKEICLLFPLIFHSNTDIIEIVSIIVSFIEKSIIESNSPIFAFIAKAFGQTINELYQSPNLSNDNKEKAYMVLLEICLSSIYNPEQHFKAAGLLLLSEFIENCPLVKRGSNLKFIWKTLGRLVDDKEYPFKLEVLNCVVSLIFATESHFQPFACDALFKILDYLTDQDWLVRKLSLNVVYSLSFYCKKEIMPLKENIIEFLNVLKYDKVKEIEEVCLQTLQFYQEDYSDKDKDKETIDTKTHVSSTKGGLTNNKSTKDPNKPLNKSNSTKGRTNLNEKRKEKESDNQYNTVTHTSKSNGKHKGPKAIKGSDKRNDSLSKSNNQKLRQNDQMLLDQDLSKLKNTQAPKRDSFFSNKLSTISKCIDDPHIRFSNRLNKTKKKRIANSMTKSDTQYCNESNRQYDNNDNTFNNDIRVDGDKTESVSMIPALSQTAEKKIEELVDQIKLINENQLNLISTIERIETLTRTKYNEFDIRLSTIEESFSSFSNAYYESRIMNEIETAIQRNEITKAFHLSSNSNNLVLQTISSIRQRQLIKVPQEAVDTYLLKAVAILSSATETEIEKILNFILQVYNEKLCVKSSVKQTIKETMNNLLQSEINNNFNEVVLNKIRSIISHSY